jgi:hypothetical protein
VFEREREREKKIQQKIPNLYLFKSLGRKEILYTRVGARMASFGIIGHQTCNWESKLLQSEITGTQN